MKKCSKCHIEKELCEFNKSKLYSDGRRAQCRECQKKESKEYREKNRDKINEKLRIQYTLNPEVQKQRTKKWIMTNESNYRSSYIKSNKKWVENNKELRKKYMREYSKKRIDSDFLFKMSRNVRIRINKFIKNKSNSTKNIVGISFIDLKLFLEKKFIGGMTWDNYGKWHIDHIIPLSSAKSESELYALCHYTNLQPLWAKDNLKKSNKIL